MKIEDDSTLPGTSYQYRLVAMNFDHNSTPSNVVNVTTPALPAQSPGVEARFFNGELAASPQNPGNIMVNGNPGEFVADSFGLIGAGGVVVGAVVSAGIGWFACRTDRDHAATLRRSERLFTMRVRPTSPSLGTSRRSGASCPLPSRS